VVDHEELGGTFYVFYDKLQLIQAMSMPKFIDELDCRLSLYRNCRNTENIATTSLKPITERKPKVFEGAVKGAPAKVHFCDDAEDEIGRIDSTINALGSDGIKDIVILTCRTEKNSVLSERVNNGLYRQKYRFTTCRKFKGLEADAVILIDVDKETFREANEETYRESNVFVYYVGASRARLRLDVFTTMSDEDCSEALESKLHYPGKIKKAKKDFASALNAIGSQKD
jgi:superfamily I DNA/RNA helicase